MAQKHFVLDTNVLIEILNASLPCETGRKT